MITNLFETPIFVSNIDAKKIKFKHEKIGVTKDWISKTISSHSNKNVLTDDSIKYLMDCIIKSLDRKYRNLDRTRFSTIHSKTYTTIKWIWICCSH